jgi:hypothetical protein
LDDLTADVKLGAFFDEDFGFFTEVVFADGLRALAWIKESAGRELEAADVFGRDGGGAVFRRGAVMDGDFAGGLGG